MDEMNKRISELKKEDGTFKNENKKFIPKKKKMVYPTKIIFRKNKNKTDKYKEFFKNLDKNEGG
jgi:hypothetical protein